MFCALVRDRPGGTPLLRVGECIHAAPLRAEPPSLHSRLARWPDCRQRSQQQGGERLWWGLLLCLLCLPNHLPCCLCSQSAMPPLPASLTDLPGRFLRLVERSTEPRLQSVSCDYTTDARLPALHEATRALGDTTGAAPGHLYDTWRWLTLEGELSAVRDLQVMLATNGVLLSVTTDVKTSTGVQIITHYPAAMALSLPLLAFAQTADATSRELLLRCIPYFRRIHGNSFRHRLRQLLLGLTDSNSQTFHPGPWIFPHATCMQPCPKQVAPLLYIIKCSPTSVPHMDPPQGHAHTVLKAHRSTQALWFFRMLHACNLAPNKLHLCCTS